MKMRARSWLVLGAIFLMLGVSPVAAQSTSISYQGSLTSAGSPVNGNHDFEFALFDALTEGNQLGTTQTRSAVPVTAGVFRVELDFGGQFTGTQRFLEIRVRPAGGGAFTTLSPRQPITSAPYSIKSLTADNAATAQNALSLGGVPAADYVITTDPRMTNARSPIAGSPNYIQNTVNQQNGVNFSISGNGTLGGTLTAPTVKVGGSGELFAPGGEENLRIIRGTVYGTNILAGSGFTSAFTPASNQYVVTFVTPFSSPPTVTFGTVNLSAVEQYWIPTLISSPTATSFTVRVYNNGQNPPSQVPLHFIAIGPRL